MRKYEKYVKRNLSREEQRKEVDKLAKEYGKPEVGQTWYAIENGWYEQFRTVDGDIPLVDNTPIFNPKFKGLKPEVVENQDYTLVCRDVFRCYNTWFKVSPEIGFYVKLDSNDIPVIDIYPARFYLIVEDAKDDDEKTDSESTSKKSTTETKEKSKPESKSDSKTEEVKETKVESKENTKAESKEDIKPKSKEDPKDEIKEVIKKEDTKVDSKEVEEVKNVEQKSDDKGTIEEKAKEEPEREKEEENKEEAEEEEEEKEKGIKKPKGTTLVSLSRYQRLGRLKSLISRHLKVRPQQVELFLLDPTSEENEYIEVAKFSEEELKKQMHEFLPNLGLIAWHVKCIKHKIDENAMDEQFLFTPENPQVNQRVDAMLDKRWLEAKIIEVTPIKGKVIKPIETEEKEEVEKNEEENDEIETEKEKLKVQSNFKIKVHFLSFDSSKDRLFKADADEIDLAYSRVPDWRQQIRKGTKVEINKSVFSTSKDWISVEVIQIDRKGVSKLRSKYAQQLANKETTVKEGMFTKIKKVFKFKTKINRRGRRRKKSKVQSIKKEKVKAKQKLSRSDSVDSNTLEVSYSGLVLVSPVPQTDHYYNLGGANKEYVVDLGSEDIAAEGTHIQKKKIGKGRGMAFQFNRDISKKPLVSGAVGFRNLGNTCYMNSILQCLMATTPITDYFISGEYKKDINRKNPIGFGGKIAISYGKLVEQYFSNKFSVIAPSDFKNVFGTCNTNFAGNRQHDSQEFLTVLLDSLHEDLNKVIEKPYVEIPDANGRSDEIMSKISWDNHLMRNKSIFIDHVFGQQRSHLTCPIPNCGNETTRFDPFNNLVLPIPFKNEVVINLLVVTIKPRLVKVIINEETEEETHVLLNPKDKIEEGDVIKETRHFRFKYLAESLKLVPTLAAMWGADELGIARERVVMYMLKTDNTLSTLVHTPFHRTVSWCRVNKKSRFIILETNEIDFPDAVLNVKEKVVSAQRLFDNFINGKAAPKRIVTVPKKKVTKAGSPKKKVSSDEETKKKDKVDKRNTKKSDNTSGSGSEEKTTDIVPTSKVSDVSSIEFEITSTKQNKNEPLADAVVVSHSENAKKSKSKEKSKMKEVSTTKNKPKKAKKKDKKKEKEKEVESDEESVVENLHVMKLKFKKLVAYSSKFIKNDEVLVVDELIDTDYSIFAAIWKRIKCMFDLKELKEEHYSATYDQVSEEELEFAQEVLKIKYGKHVIKPDKEVNFVVKRTGFAKDTIYIEVSTKVSSLLKEGLKLEPPASSSYSDARLSIEKLNKSLNVGFIYSHQTVHTLGIEEEVDLYQCFDTYRKPEQLEDAEDWYCNRCKAHVQKATKKLDVYNTGDVLVIVLKRFRTLAFTSTKLDLLVSFPIENLDLSEYIQGDQEKFFDLFGVSYHMGGLGGGHYIAKVRVGDDWYKFDDASVKKCEKEDIVNSNAYVLFYRKKNKTEKE